MTHGLYRRKKLGRRGKHHDTGAYVIDMRIKRVPELAGIRPRLFKTTGVLPNSRNAEVIVREMKLMVKELIFTRDASTLKRIQDNKLSLPSAYEKWKAGRIHLAQGFEDQSVVKLWIKYYKDSPIRPTTRANRLAIIAALLNKELLTEKHVINDLTEILPRIHRHYAHTKQGAAFNTIRIELKSFLTKGLGMDSISPFVRAVDRTEVMKLARRREHHPFDSPHECIAFCQQVLKRQTPNAELFALSVLFMCRHGMRPEEFAQRRFSVDAKTGHLRVKGIKNVNAERVVPYIFEFDSADPPRIDTLNATFLRFKSKVRCRDFRRTYAIWCQEARIPHNRIQAYMGHGAQNVTQTYQQATPNAKILDEDRKTLEKWFNAQLAKAPVKREAGVPLTAFRALRAALHPSLGQMRARIESEDESDAAFDAKHGR